MVAVETSIFMPLFSLFLGFGIGTLISLMFNLEYDENKKDYVLKLKRRNNDRKTGAQQEHIRRTR